MMCEVVNLKAHCEVRMGGVFVKLESVMSVPQSAPSGQWEIVVPLTEESAVSRCFGYVNPPDLTTSFNQLVIESVVVEDCHINTSTPVQCPPNRYTFVAPITLSPGDYVRLFVTYFQPPLFDYTTKSYTFCLPLSTDQKNNDDIKYTGPPLEQVSSVSCLLSDEIEILSEPIVLGIPYSTVEGTGGMGTWLTSNPGSWKNHDFVISYKYKTRQQSAGIASSALLEDPKIVSEVPATLESSAQLGACYQFPDISHKPGGATLAISLDPCRDAMIASFNRAVVFVIDKSYTMNGEPLQAAKLAVNNALPTLAAGDMFCVIEFDHTHSITVPMTPVMQSGSIEYAKDMVSRIMIGGGTSITEPMSTAMSLLRQVSAHYLPFIILLTDGHVHDEPNICQYVTDEHLKWGTPYPPRILTFGIGDYCNTNFIQMLAILGRGHSMTASTDNIALLTAKMTRLISLAGSPVLTNIAVFRSDTDEQLATYPIPDLTLGCSIMIYSLIDMTDVPKNVRVSGFLASGQQWGIIVSVTRTAAPLSKLAAKRELELLSCSAWLENNINANNLNDTHRQEAIARSYASNVVCPGVTRFVVVGVRANEYESYQERQRKTKTADERREANALLLGVGACVVVGLPFALGVHDSDLITHVVAGDNLDGDCCDCDCDCDAGMC
eukprot:TRINITY_DN870_c0_g3_i1.p1 TRINITY_DN870_c0_g3~~TRINITY_DN870_c0_g3_i1.p1  ORF type:complete len:731 (+),score=105.33 TRINITY_DN870_c0_g3_i1:200-2194(+)